jgi:hypothetical protein
MQPRIAMQHALPRGCTALAAFVATLLGGVSAATATDAAGAEQEGNACVEAYESAQEQRLAGSLKNARARTEACAIESCPEFIRSDCTKWRAEIDAELPSVSFSVKSNGIRLTQVRITEDERVLAERADGSSVELDPGNHSFRFEAPGTQPMTRAFVLERGQKNRLVDVELLPLAPPPQPKPDTPRTDSKTPVLPWVLVGTGVLGLTAFTLFGSAGLSEEAKLERTCAPSCSDEELQSVKTKYLVADISLGVGVGSLLVGGYMLLTHDPEPVASARAFPVRIQAGTRGGMASVTGKF